MAESLRRRSSPSDSTVHAEQKAQRDLYSAYLACGGEKNTLRADQAQKAWAGMDIALRTATRELKQSSSGPLPASLGLRSGSEIVVRTVS